MADIVNTQNYNYVYLAQCINVIDGDTIDLDVDLGFDIRMKRRFRLYGINAYEIFGVSKDSEEYRRGMEAKQLVESLILNKKIVIESYKDKTDKYGRYLAMVYLDDGTCLNSLLVEKGLAVTYE
ncbi:MAG: thermonuclease family protein [Candidatus Aenigmatarchaeota archaeon]